MSIEPIAGSNDHHKSEGVNASSESDSDTSSDEDFIGNIGEIPRQLQVETCGALMAKKWELARKLVRMMLIYEPQNVMALEFKSVLQERMELDADDSEEGDSDENEIEDSDEEEHSSESQSIESNNRPLDNPEEEELHNAINDQLIFSTREEREKAELEKASLKNGFTSTESDVSRPGTE